MSKSKKILKEARDLLKENGWGTNFMHHPDTGTYCAVGAILAAAKQSNAGHFGKRKTSTLNAIAKLAKSIDPTQLATVEERLTRHHSPTDPESIVMTWNDGVAWGQSQVLDVFDRAING